MKQILTAISLLLPATVLQAAPAIVVQNGRGRCQIVTPETPSPAVTYAAGELQKFIDEITGMRLPIVSEKKARRGPAFLLGPCRRTMKASLLEQASKLGEDGVFIKTVAKTSRCWDKTSAGIFTASMCCWRNFGASGFWPGIARSFLSAPNGACRRWILPSLRRVLPFKNMPAVYGYLSVCDRGSVATTRAFGTSIAPPQSVARANSQKKSDPARRLSKSG